MISKINKCIGCSILYTLTKSILNNIRTILQRGIYMAVGNEQEETLFIKMLGIKSPVLAIMDFLMDNEAFDYSKSDIAEGAGMSRTTLSTVWPKLEENNLVILTRVVGRAKMYKLNTKNPVVKKLIELDNAICEFYSAQIAEINDNKDPMLVIS